jgi:hypothetical protein
MSEMRRDSSQPHLAHIGIRALLVNWEPAVGG